MHEADLALAAEVADDTAPRDVRDDKASTIREMLVDYASLVEGTYGTSLVTACGLEGKTPRSGDELTNDAEHIVRLLQGNPVSSVEPKPGREPLNATKMASALGSEVDRFRAALADVSREERQYQVALSTRDQSVARWSTAYPAVAEALGAFYQLAGRSDLAEYVRPTARRRAGQPELTDVTRPAACRARGLRRARN